VNHVLLDTQLLLWAAAADEKLPDAVIKRLDDQHTQPLFSAASIWEIVIKTGLGREDFNVDAAVLRRGLIDNGYRELRNPFDRILAAQANEEGIELLTADRTLAQYPGSITLVEAQHRGAGG
jgi:PIN domain nuclease of toxin-antitoxin system